MIIIIYNIFTYIEHLLTRKDNQNLLTIDIATIIRPDRFGPQAFQQRLKSWTAADDVTTQVDPGEIGKVNKKHTA